MYGLRTRTLTVAATMLAAGTLAATAAFGVLPGIANAEVLTFSDYAPNRGTRAAALKTFADEVKAGTDGKVEIQFFWGGSLVGGKATLQGLADGAADMGTVIGFFTPAQLRAYNIGDLPMPNSDVWVGMSALHELARTNEALQAEFDAAGVHYVSNYTTTPIQLVCKPEVSSLEDLASLKIRASGPYGKALAELGAEVVSMSQADVYQALDSGLIDCNQNYYYAIRSYKQYEIAPHVVELNWGQNMAFGIFMSKLTYERLGEDERAAIDAAGAAFIDLFARAQIEGLNADKQAMLEGIDGNEITVTTLSEADRAKLIAAGRVQVGKWVEDAKADGLNADAVLAAYEGLISKHAVELESKGYPWK